MSILSALNTGAGGIAQNSLELSVIGDNIANANTVGFKSSRAVFEDQLAETMIGQGNAQVGLGTRLQTVQRMTMQGALLSTNHATDLALEGSGYFMVQGALNGRSGTYYTRAGQFTLDKDGFLTNLQGLQVQGYQADATGTLSKSISNINVQNAASSPLATANITVRANLQSDANVLAAPWDPLNPSTTSNYQTSTVVYDTLGAAHQVDIYYRKTAAGAWDWHALTDGGGLTGGTAGTPTQIANGTLTFGTSGQLTASTQASAFQPLGATNPQALNFNFGTPAPAGTGLDGITQFSAASATSFISQDGYASGDLSSVNVDNQGKIIGQFTNGQTRTLGQVAVATFPAEENLQRVGGNMFEAVPSAGAVNVGTPGGAGRASVVAGTLEQSNVDMANEFVRMIAAQRGFQANSKTVTTADQLLQELMNLKR
jgi:flagellar hook protein FlgE